MNFAIFSRHATASWLVIFAPDGSSSTEYPLDPSFHRSGDVWHVELGRFDDGKIVYGWRFSRSDTSDVPLHHFDPDLILIDPYATSVSVAAGEGATVDRRSSVGASGFDWQGVSRPRVAANERVIYEVHLRGFTAHPSAMVRYPGTYLGFVEKIPYLKRLGVTSIELLPVMEFDERSINPDIDPVVAQGLTNFWGYNPVNFFSPHGGYAAEPGAQVEEFKTLVRELHRAGIEVLLDVVFNHTAEGGVRERTVSFRGIDNSVYYMLDAAGTYLDFTGCRNTLNCNDPIVRRLILDSLVYWAEEMRVDGFRFDLASVLTRGKQGEVLERPPLIEEMSNEPRLAGSLLIAEAWDAAGLYHLGRFPCGERWSEWNGAFRDDVRHFVRGDEGWAGRLATRLAGSSDLFGAVGRTPLHSINFITCHDGFPLQDLVSYDRKHNQKNGEGNRDGTDDNVSWNCGVEGETHNTDTRELRRRQRLNFLAALFLSQGVPMLLGGDEMGRTQRGNNNAYCHDNEISWFDWALLEENGDLFEFTRQLIEFRRTHPVLRRKDFFTGSGGTNPPDVIWHGVTLFAPDFSPHSRSLALQLSGSAVSPSDCDLYFAYNAWKEALRFQLPLSPSSPAEGWTLVFNTARETSDAFAERSPEAREELSGSIDLQPYSCVLLRG